MKFLRHILSLSAVSLATVGVGLMAIPAIASAQEPPPAPSSTGSNANCPPGSWFCADTQQSPAAPANQPVGGQPLQQLPPPDQEQPPPPPHHRYAPPPLPPVVVYQPPPPIMIVRPEAPPPYLYRPHVPSWYRRNEWGLNLHLEGAMIGRGINGNAGMGGAGFGLRYKPIPYFGIEADVDFVGGRDYQDFQRDESAFTMNGLVFLNPKSRAQIYLLGGFGWSGAQVTDDSSYNLSNSQRTFSYSYFGGQAGVGLEVRLGKHFAINGDLRGFIRGRTDNGAQQAPEFVDASGRSTNTSGGGIFTLGMTFYF